MPVTQSLKVKDLSLDTHNFRTVPQADEASAIHPLITLDPGYFWALMESLVDNGYLPTESIIVLKQGRTLVVKEGNRRIAALKLIHCIVPMNDYDLPVHLADEISKLTPAYFHVIGELQIANRRQCRFQPRRRVRNDKEATFDGIVEGAPGLSPSFGTNQGDVL